MKNHLLILALVYTQVAFAQWIAVSSGTTVDLHGVYFFDIDTGLVAGDGLTIRKTLNGGNSWSNVTIDNSVTGGIVRKLAFNQNKTIGIAVVELNNNTSVFLRTTDRGNNWTAVHQVAGKMKSVAFYDVDKILVAGDLGEIYKSETAGNSWNLISPSISFDIADISCTGNQTCYVCGVTGSIYKSTNGGNTWNSVSIATAINFRSVVALNKDTVFIVGSNNSGSYLVSTLNGGTNWTPPLNMQVDNINDIYFSDVLHGFVVGGSPVISSNSQYVARTVNNGVSWEQQQEATQRELFGVFFIDALNGYAVGVNGTVIKTTNGGVTGIAEKNKIENLMLFPNPVHDFITAPLESRKPYDYTIIDISGKIVLSGSMKQSETAINVKELFSGNYLLQIMQEGKTFSGQFIKK